jgi:putative ABC transport system permease protein
MDTWMLSYVRRDLVRNPRRTLGALAGIMLGVGLFSGVLFFIDGSAATMTKRAIAPLALDMQRVMASPLGGELTLRERIVGPGALKAGQEARIVLTISNEGAEPAHEVVVNDEPSPSLGYVAGTTKLDGKPLRDKGGQIPLTQGLARSGLNIGTVAAGTSRELSYVVRARESIPSIDSLPPHGTISSREDFVPSPANQASPLTVDQLRTRIAAIPGVSAADELSFVDLPPGSIRAKGAVEPGPVRVFAFDRGYPDHYREIRLIEGSLAPGSALLSAEAARGLNVMRDQSVSLELPGHGRSLTLPVSGIADLSRARPLFYSRETNKLEDFLYVPDALVVSPATFESEIIPAFRAARAERGNIVKALPLQEVDILVDRSQLSSDPATALAQTQEIARSIERISPGEDYLIDNISNTLQVAKQDAAIGKRMFFFLGLPGVLLAAFLAAYTGGILAAGQRREVAMLRVRGAHRGHLRRILVYRTFLLAGAGSLAGIALGLLSGLLVLTPGVLFDASSNDLVTSGLIAALVGMVVTGNALYIPGRRSLSREVAQEQAEVSIGRPPVWRRYFLDLVLLAGAGLIEIALYRAGVFDPPTTSVSLGESAALPSSLLLAPVIAWVGGVLLLVRIFVAVASRVPVPSPPRFGPVIRGTLVRSLRRRAWALGSGVVGVGLVVSFGICLALFTATYDQAKVADSRFVLGSDLRITPSVLSPNGHPPGYASNLHVSGIAGVTPVVFKLENAVLIGENNQDRADLTAIQPESFGRVAALADSFFVERSAADSMAALQADPHSLLVDSDAAEGLGIAIGDRVQVLLARGTKHQSLEPFRVVGFFTQFPGFPQHTTLVANLDYYVAATGLKHVDFFLARTTDQTPVGRALAVTALRSGPGREDPINIETSETALDKDQSSLTALNVHGLVNLNSLYTLLMGAAVIAIFVLGMMMQRKREYMTLHALGMQTWELHVMLLAEAALVALLGLAAGVLVGAGMAFSLIHILRPLFILDPEVTFAAEKLLTLTIVALAATLGSALIATAILQRSKPSELLRAG